VTLHRLRLENFRQHVETDVVFEPGMTAVIGANGAGKSTLVEAIGFALYGEQRDKKETVRFHWGSGKRFVVRLEFSVAGHRYVAERTDRDATLIQLGEKEIVRAEGLTETTRACERLLGLSYEQFANSFYAEQKQLAFLQFRSNAVRQEEVARMLGFDRLRLAEELAGQRRREATLQREALERTMVDPAALAADRERAQTRLTDADRTLAETGQRLADLEREAEGAETARRQAERWLALGGEIQVREGEAAGFVALVESTAAGVREAEGEVAERTRLQAAAEAFEAAELRLRERLPIRTAAQAGEAARRALSQAESELASVESELAALGDVEADLTEAQARRGAAEDALASALAAWSSRRETVAVAAAETRAVAEQATAAWRAAEASLAAGRCPECGQPVGPAYAATVQERRETAERAQAEAARQDREVALAAAEPAEIAGLRHAVEAAREAVAGAERRHARSVAARQTHQRAAVRAAEARAAVAAIPPPEAVAEVDALEAEVQRLRASHARYEALAPAEDRLRDRERRHREAVQKLRHAQAAADALRAEQAELPFPDAAAAGHAVNRHVSLAEEIARRRADQAGARASREVAERDLRYAEERLAAQATLAEEVRALRDRESLHDLCAREMRTLRQELNTGIGPELAAHASESLALLTNGRYSALELDRNFAAAVIEDGVRKPVLSGGEEDVVALALRLALSELIQERTGQPLSLLILDEVFGSLDAERRQAVLDRLAALRGRFAQILVITHLEDVHQVADHVLYVSRDPETRTSVVRDELPPE
jgi:exonuclease SbcC